MGDTSHIIARVQNDDPSFDEVNLRSKSLSLESVSKLCDAFKDNTHAKYLNISSNNLGVDGAKYLASLIESTHTLQKLHMEVNNIGPDGTTAIAKALTVNNSVQMIHLADNRIGLDGIRELAQMLVTNSTLTELRIDNNKIVTEGIVYLSESLKKNSTLHHLYLGITGLELDGLKSLSDALKQNIALLSISLDCNRIGPDGATVISKALEVNSTLNSLSLWGNSIGKEGCAQIISSLAKNYSLKTLNLYGNKVTDDGAFNALASVVNNHSLTNLDLSSNEINPTLLETIQNVIAASPSDKSKVIEVLNLSNCKYALLPPGLTNMTQIRELNLENNKLAALPMEFKRLVLLRHLNLKQNLFTKIPIVIRLMRSLEVCQLQNNPMKESNVKQLTDRSDLKEMIAYLRSFDDEHQVWFESTVFLLGAQGVGKTSLIERLRGATSQAIDSIQPTIEIETKPWNIQMNIFDENHEIKLTTWDFSGIDEYSITHWYFLGSAGLYILVWNVTDPQSIYKVDFWIRNILAIRAAATISKPGKLRIIAIGTHVNSATAQALFTKESASLQKRFGDCLDSVFAFDCFTGRGIEDIIQLIKSIMPDLLQSTRRCFKFVGDIIEDLQTETKSAGGSLTPFVTFEGVEQRLDGIQSIKEDNRLQVALELFHNLGRIVYLGKRGPSHIIVTDPLWLVTAMESFVTHRDKLSTSGEVTLNQLQTLWGTKIANEAHPAMLHALIELEFIFELPEVELFDETKDSLTRYFVPTLLPAHTPSFSILLTNASRPIATEKIFYASFVPMHTMVRVMVKVMNDYDIVYRWMHGFAAFNKQLMRDAFVVVEHLPTSLNGKNVIRVLVKSKPNLNITEIMDYFSEKINDVMKIASRLEIQNGENIFVPINNALIIHQPNIQCLIVERTNIGFRLVSMCLVDSTFSHSLLGGCQRIWCGGEHGGLAVVDMFEGHILNSTILIKETEEGSSVRSLLNVPNNSGRVWIGYADGRMLVVNVQRFVSYQVQMSSELKVYIKASKSSKGKYIKAEIRDGKVRYYSGDKFVGEITPSKRATNPARSVTSNKPQFIVECDNGEEVKFKVKKSSSQDKRDLKEIRNKWIEAICATVIGYGAQKLDVLRELMPHQTRHMSAGIQCMQYDGVGRVWTSGAEPFIQVWSSEAETLELQMTIELQTAILIEDYIRSSSDSESELTTTLGTEFELFREVVVCMRPLVKLNLMILGMERHIVVIMIDNPSMKPIVVTKVSQITEVVQITEESVLVIEGDRSSSHRIKFERIDKQIKAQITPMKNVYPIKSNSWISSATTNRKLIWVGDFEGKIWWAKIPQDDEDTLNWQTNDDSQQNGHKDRINSIAQTRGWLWTAAWDSQLLLWR